VEVVENGQHVFRKNSVIHQRVINYKKFPFRAHSNALLWNETSNCL